METEGAGLARTGKGAGVQEKGRCRGTAPFLVYVSRGYQLNRNTNWIVRDVFVPLSPVIW